MGFQRELLELLERYEADITVDMDHGYDGSTVDTVDFSYNEDGEYRTLCVKGVGPDSEIDSSIFERQMTEGE